jgi:serine/threonine protein kinase
MPNGTFDSIIRAKHSGKPNPYFGPTEFSKAVFGIVSTMTQIHKHSVIHRNLMSHNIFLDDQWEVRIADFGVEEVVICGSSYNGMIRTPLFVAPELFDDENNDSISVDVFAFGVMIYTIFTPKQVFKEGDRPLRGLQQLMMKVAKGERFIRQPGIPDVFWKLITECWEHRPDDRPSFEKIVKMMLTSDEFVFEGTDMEKYREYRERMKPPDDAPVGINLSQ